MKSEWLQVGAVAVAGLALVWFLSRSNHATTTDGSSALSIPAPNYLTYNQQSPATAAQTDLPTVGTSTSSSGSGSAPSCGCGGGGNQSFYASNAAFANSLEGNINGFLQNYEENIMSQFPDYVSQFFNNPQALAEDAVAQTQFASLGNLPTSQ